MRITKHKKNKRVDVKNIKFRDELLDNSKSSKNTKWVPYIIDPKIQTHWGQGHDIYNDFCPINSNNVQSLAGCPAVALAQYLKYQEYPIQGYNVSPIVHSDPDAGDDDFGDYTIFPQDFQANYDNMPNIVTTPNSYVAEFLAHVGKLIRTDYDLRSAGSFCDFTANALSQYLGYTYNRREYSNGVNWDEMWNEIGSLPWMFSGDDNTHAEPVGHRFLIDGACQLSSSGTVKYFHVNWGWYGDCDGWFTEMIVEASEGDTYYWTDEVSIFYNLEPDCWIGWQVLVYLSNNSKSQNKTKLSDTLFDLYPNPVNEKLSISINNGNNYFIKVFNSNGQLLLQKESANYKITEINISDFADGIYLLSIFGNNEKLTKKFIVQH